MRNYLLVGCFCCLMLAGCTTTTDIIAHKKEVVLPSDAMYTCNLGGMPDPNTLTDRQVAQLIEALYKNNRRCKASLNAIHAFLEDANHITDPTVNTGVIRKVYKQHKRR